MITTSEQARARLSHAPANPFYFLRRLFVPCALLVLQLSAALCITPASAATSAAPAELRIGYQKSAINLVVLKARGTLEQRYPASRISWIEFPAGPQILEALSTGNLDIGFTGDTPPVFAQAAGRDIVYIGAEKSKPQSSAILVRPDSPLHTLADLKGHKVALQKGSSAHYLLLKAVQKAGLKWTDIEPVYLAPADARAAFERGSVDAWAIWDPYYAAAEQHGAAHVLANGSGLSDNNSFYLSTHRYASENGAFLQQFFALLTENDTYINSHQNEAEPVFAKATGLDLPTVQRFDARRSATPTGTISDALIRQQQQVADGFASLHLIPHPVRVADIVWQPRP